MLGIALILFPNSTQVSSKEVYGKVFCRNMACQGKIALTFDDGPHPRYTKEILSILEEYHITATFFIIGVNAEHYPDDLRKIVEAGCEIGNHSYSHHPVKTLSETELEQEITRCEETINQLCGIRPSIFRPPEGMVTDSLKTIISEKEYQIVLWSIDTMDWSMTPSADIYRNVTSNLHGGDIILMHDYVSGGNTTCKALRQFIPVLLQRGYKFVTVSELIKGDRE